MLTNILSGTLLALALALFAYPARARLGWTLAECEAHYGKPFNTKRRALGLTDVNFFTRGFEIEVDLDKSGKVGSISYSKAHISESLALLLRDQNAPGVTWQRYNPPEPCPYGTCCSLGKEVFYNSFTIKR